MPKLETEYNKTKDQILKLLCPDCEIVTLHVILQSIDMKGHEEPDPSNSTDWDVHYQTVQCQGSLAISFRTEINNSEDWDPIDGSHVITESIYPKRNKNSLKIKVFLNTPRNLRRINREIIENFNNDIFTLCAAGLRSIIEGLCSESGVKTGLVDVQDKGGKIKIIRKHNLQGKISDLLERATLSKTNANILHEHRFLGV